MVEHAIIMAGGAGMRLRPLTEERPKPLIPLLDEPVAGYALKLLRRHGIRQATMTLHCMADQVMQAFGDGAAYGVALRYQVEEEPRGTAGSVRDAAAGMTGTVLVLSGDGLTDCDLTAMYAYHKASGAKASLVLARVEDPSPYGLCERAPDGRILRFVEKPEGAAAPALVNTGIYFLEREVLDRIPPDMPWDFGRDVFPPMAREGLGLYGFPMRGYWCDIGNPNAYARAQTDLLMGRVGLPIRGRRVGRAILADDARVDQRAQLTGRCYVGPGAVISGGATLGPGTVIGRGAQVGQGARIEHACLWENVRVDGGSILKHVVVMPRHGNSDLQRVAPYGMPFPQA